MAHRVHCFKKYNIHNSKGRCIAGLTQSEKQAWG